MLSNTRLGSYWPVPCLTEDTDLEQAKKKKKNRFGQFSLLTVVMFSKLATNWNRDHCTIAPRGNTEQGSCEPLVVTFSLAHQYLTLFNLCFGLKTPYIIYIVDPLTVNSWSAALELTAEWSWSNTCVFSIRRIPALLHLGLLGSPSELQLETIFNGKIPTKKH